MFQPFKIVTTVSIVADLKMHWKESQKHHNKQLQSKMQTMTLTLNRDGKFSMMTSQTTELGRHKCGMTLLNAPFVDTMSSIFLDSTFSETLNVAMEQTPELDEWSEENTLQNKRKLYELAIKAVEITRSNIGEDTAEVPIRGTLKNIRDYAKHAFRNDKHQCKAFELIVAAFLVQLHTGPQHLGKRQRTLNKICKDLQTVNHDGQFVAFLSGPGGTGKSKVINSVLQYCKAVCDQAQIPFTKRTITVTALTGAAAVNIFGETTHSACRLNGKVTPEKIMEWKDTKMVIVDEISFASKQILLKLNK